MWHARLPKSIQMCHSIRLAKAFYRDHCAHWLVENKGGKKKSTVIDCDASNAGTKTMYSNVPTSMLHRSDRVLFAFMNSMPVGQSCKYAPHVQISIRPLM
jgi:hypothetical protein